MADMKVRIFGANAPTGTKAQHECGSLKEAAAWMSSQKDGEKFDVSIEKSFFISGITASEMETQLSSTT